MKNQQGKKSFRIRVSVIETIRLLLTLLLTSIHYELPLYMVSIWNPNAIITINGLHHKLEK